MRIAIVNDSAMARNVLSRIISDMSGHRVAWVADDGAEAVRKAAEDTPDLILMDLVMPVEDGVSATRRIMTSSPCPILIVTASVGRNSSLIFQALGAGALDVVRTPEASKGAEGWDLLLRKIGALRLLFGERSHPVKRRPEEPGGATVAVSPLIAIGASAGGPGALATVLKGMGADFTGAIVISQHISADFIEGLAKWLESQCSLPVRVAQEGGSLLPGTVFVANPSGHLELTASGRFGYAPVTPEDCVSPLVDRLFSSIAQNWRGRAAAVLLTGMGSDGVAGMLEMKNKGFLTIAESKETCLVFGMPGAAVRAGAAREVLPSNSIAARLKESLVR